MKTKSLLTLCFITLHLAFSISARAQGTAFTYQGRLNDGANPATGTYDLRFTIYDSTNNPGTVIAGPLTNSATAVSNGLFTVTLDFGGNVFTGPARWLEIGVRPGGSVNDFATLAPRQPLTPAPYAMFAPVAGTVTDGAITASKLAAGTAAANLQAGGQSAVAGGGVVLSEQPNAMELINAGYVKIGRVNLIDEAWQAQATGPTGLGAGPLARIRHSALWTGSEMIIWGGTDGNNNLLNTGARYNPAAATWTRINTTNAPAARTGHRAVWTGTEMIVWGGFVASFFGNGVTNTGARYNPTTDTWTAITAGGGSRQNHSAFWNGTEMLVWGGTFISSGAFGTSVVPTSNGARYNLAGNNWTFISSTGVPVPRQEYSAVWNGTDMIVWGGYDYIGSFLATRTNYGDGARYRPANNTWTAISTTGAPFRRDGHSAVWSGTQMIVWGGRTLEGFGETETNYNGGARYNWAADTWSSMATAGAPAPRYDHTAVWANDRMVVWGGTDSTNVFDSGARYFPAANVWSNVTATARPGARSEFSTVWSGTEMIVWGGWNGFYFDLGGRYNPVSDGWTATAPTGERSERRGHTAVWTGSEMIVWGGFDGERNLNTGGRYNPTLNSWSPTTTNSSPAGRTSHSAVWSGTQMIIWGGFSSALLNTGGRYNPATDAWLATAPGGAPTARTGHSAVWTDSEMIVWGGLDGAGLLRSGGRYNPVANTWTATPTPGAPAVRSGHVSVWTGADMLVWGGTGGTVVSPVPLATGGRYNRASNSWSSLPTSGAPAARTEPRAVWSGGEMLVWGGLDLTNNLNTGGRFHSVSNSWRSMTTNGAPSPRLEHTAVWAGTRMIAWGGFDGTNYLRTGGVYDPLADVWTATELYTNAPPARSQHVAVWTGAEMVVHGGYSVEASNGLTDYLDDTWHYTPPRTMFLYLKP